MEFGKDCGFESRAGRLSFFICFFSLSSFARYFVDFICPLKDPSVLFFCLLRLGISGIPTSLLVQLVSF
ncbi:hypothetical protein GGR50DRAFT_671303 [Xylaria sp. CBS 124048]|nr:hypothetical protein GGR50DRAFT_671303 [Xylaria sp. CBS 124048]